MIFQMGDRNVLHRLQRSFYSVDFTFTLIKEKLEDIKILNDENRRLKIDLLNMKSYNDNSKYYFEDDNE